MLFLTFMAQADIELAGKLAIDLVTFASLDPESNS